jgi:lysine 6-dehydrogenase
MSYTQEDELRIKVLNELGLTRTDPIKIGEVEISPKEFLLKCVPPPDVKAKDAASLIVEIKGEKDGNAIKLTYSLVQRFHEVYGVSAIAYLTGVPLSIVSQMLAKEEIKEKGVSPPETAVPHEKFFKELAKRNIIINETFQKTSKLI